MKPPVFYNTLHKAGITECDNLDVPANLMHVEIVDLELLGGDSALLYLLETDDVIVNEFDGPTLYYESKDDFFAGTPAPTTLEARTD